MHSIPEQLRLRFLHTRDSVTGVAQSGHDFAEKNTINLLVPPSLPSEHAPELVVSEHVPIIPEGHFDMIRRPANRLAVEVHYDDDAVVVGANARKVDQAVECRLVQVLVSQVFIEAILELVSPARVTGMLEVAGELFPGYEFLLIHHSR